MTTIAQSPYAQDTIEPGPGGEGLPPIDPDNVYNVATRGTQEEIDRFADRHPDQLDTLEDELMRGGRLPELSALSTHLRGDGPAVVDVYIGGGGDESIGHVVENYEAGLEDTPTRSSQYFNWRENDEAVAYIDAKIDAGYTVNIIGHSYGGTTAVEVAGRVDGRVNMLAGIDPVPHPIGTMDEAVRADPLSNVDHVVHVDDTNNEEIRLRGPLSGDAIENYGLLIGGEQAEVYRAPDTYRFTDFGHESFRDMMTHRPVNEQGNYFEPSVADLIEASHDGT